LTVVTNDFLTHAARMLRKLEATTADDLERGWRFRLALEHELILNRWGSAAIKRGHLPSPELLSAVSRLLWWYLRHDREQVDPWFPPLTRQGSERAHADGASAGVSF